MSGHHGDDGGRDRGLEQHEGPRVARPSFASPPYDDLPPASRGGRSGWGLFGPDDSVGLLNLQTPARVLEAASLVRKGAVFALNAALDAIDPPLDSDRGMPRHHLVHQPGKDLEDFDDLLDNFYPQASSQWDSLAHIAYAPGIFYNAATDADIVKGARNTIDHWARRGIVARAVLLDLARSFEADGIEYEPNERTAFSPADLERARERAGVAYSTGCVIVLRTGFVARYCRRPRAQRRTIAQSPRAPGIEHTEAMARYLWDSGAMAVASDTFAVEVWPPDLRTEASPFGFLHRVLIGQFGMALGELWELEDLAADCAGDGVHEFLLTSAPMNSVGGVGSPANALAIK